MRKLSTQHVTEKQTAFDNMKRERKCDTKRSEKQTANNNVCSSSPGERIIYIDKHVKVKKKVSSNDIHR